MKKLSLSLVMSLLSMSVSASAQIQVDGGDGNTVTIGPDGIHVNSPSGGTNLNIGPSGISGVAGGSTRLNIGNPVHGRVNSTLNRSSASAAKSSTSNVNAQSSTGNAVSLQDRVSQLEIVVSGKASSGLPLVSRVEKLEEDNLGKKGSGSLADRVKALEATIGVRSTSSKSSTSTSSTRIVNNNTGNNAGVIVETGKGSSSRITTQVGNSGVQTASEITASGDGQNLNYSVNGGTVTLNGSRCTARINGHCDSLVVNGSDNTITGDFVKEIVFNGANNKTSWNPACKATVVDNGKGNEVKLRN